VAAAAGTNAANTTRATQRIATALRVRGMSFRTDTHSSSPPDASQYPAAGQS
jgi:hypothetical protein